MATIELGHINVDVTQKNIKNIQNMLPKSIKNHVRYPSTKKYQKSHRK